MFKKRPEMYLDEYWLLMHMEGNRRLVWIDSEEGSTCPHCGSGNVEPEIKNIVKETKSLTEGGRYPTVAQMVCWECGFQGAPYYPVPMGSKEVKLRLPHGKVRPVCYKSRTACPNCGSKKIKYDQSLAMEAMDLFTEQHSCSKCGFKWGEKKLCAKKRTSNCPPDPLLSSAY